MNDRSGQRRSSTESMQSYFALLGYRVAFGASDDPDVTFPVWQVGPRDGDHLHVLEFRTRSAFWRWWRDRVAPEHGEDDPIFTLVSRMPGWTRNALMANVGRAADPQYGSPY